ncbi:putative adenylyltransferase/sulfurtransferase MoeZ [Aquimixticola soesokkakensis]|uniref:Putative adenylyltransferase/sulfurtransferase MoeZ n=1 Tax=Aquimixticola soesokkakensis TaxID=1519096 RepID=A0A1Y5THR8_9RHOB|nr:HesA/MoeB/ThiF family protein [Aquimixticola soesokkakensis]SLN64128.1 putative adenylyltransferase/sulfurtransferase MoeZ [Aquimixticola soesokkakensis]
MTRYARQMRVPEVGSAGQARLSGAHAVIVGLGGLGCPALHYLAGAGVGRITVFDPDIVDVSNLHRQTLYRMSDLGKPKAQAAAAFVRAFNPEIDLRACAVPLSPDSACDVARDADVVIDAADSFAVSYILSDACRSTATPLICASVLGQTGYIGGFCAGAPSLRAVFADLPTSGATCASAGVLGPVVGMFGALQAQMALRVLLGHRPSGLGQMITADLAQMRFGGFDFQDSREPERFWPFVSPQSLRPEDLVVELRGVDEAPQPIVAQALRLDAAGVADQVVDQLATLPAHPDRRIVLCCRSGQRAWQAAGILEARGFHAIALMAAVTCG